MSQPSRCKKLALLVGSNPLPNYLAAVVLNPEEEIVLVYTRETQEVCNRLENELNRRFKFDQKFKISRFGLSNATDARRIRAEIQKLDIDHLHYTGGTKTMAAHALWALREKGFNDRQFSYLDERKGMLLFDDENWISLEDCKLDLTLDVILSLHGVERVKETTKNGEELTEKEIMILEKDSEEFIREYIKFMKNPKDKKDTKKDMKDTKKEDAKISIDVFKNIFKKSKILSNQENLKVWKKVRLLESNKWFEIWTSKIIKDCLKKETSGVKIDVGVKFKRVNYNKSTNFEIDVVLLRGHRLYVLSCTTTQDSTEVKWKLFEVAIRARQMGGDLARSAIVCFLDKEQQNNVLEKLRSDIADLWKAPNTPEVFGLPELQEWAGINTEPNLTTLEEWLNR